MKKLVFLSLLLTLLASAVFAQDAGISIGGWGRGAFSPLIFHGEDKDDTKKRADSETFVGTGVTWQGNLPNYEFTVTGTSPYVGFGLGLNSAAEKNPIGGNDLGAHVWGKPFASDILKVTVGKFVDDTLRGKVGSLNGGFETFVLPAIGYEEDAIFNRFSAGSGFMLSSAPMEGLFLGLKVDAPNLWSGQLTAKEAYKYIQIGAGYEIGGIGHIRAQFLGGDTSVDEDFYNKRVAKVFADYFTGDWDGDGVPNSLTDLSNPDNLARFQKLLESALASLGENKSAAIEAAFALTAVENLTLDLGIKIFLPYKYDYTLSYPSVPAGFLPAAKGEDSDGAQVSLGAKFSAGDLGIGARIDTTFGGYRGEDSDNRFNDPFALGVRIVPSYNVGFATIGLDFGLLMTGKSSYVSGGTKTERDDAGAQFGIGAFIQRDLGNGRIQTGFTFTGAPTVDGKTDGHPTFVIPVILEYSF